MARATPRTWLSLDEWATLLGIAPLHFNMLQSVGLPLTNCSQAYVQHAFQSTGGVGRDDVAQAIDEAEKRLAELLGYHLVHDWRSERIRVNPPWQTSLVHIDKFSFDGFPPRLDLDRGRFITGGQRLDTLLAAAAVIVWPGGGDEDYADNRFATVTIAGVDADLDPCTVRAYYETDADPNEIFTNPDDPHEVRPIESATLSGTTITLRIRRELLVRPELWEATDPEVADADANASFVAALDIYSVTNDPQDQAQLEWLPSAQNGSGACGSCTACQIGSQTGCVTSVEREPGIVSFSPASWDAATETFTSAEFAVCRAPDRVLVHYYSGAEPRAGCSAQMDPELARIVAYYAASLLEGELCGCETAQRITRWREDRTIGQSDGVAHNLPDADATNPLGTTFGATFAWRRIRNRLTSRPVPVR